jgi:hypothetical protein
MRVCDGKAGAKEDKKNGAFGLSGRNDVTRPALRSAVFA